jgi:signal transduction histidine kinase
VIEVSRDVSELATFTATLRLVLLAAGGLALIIALVASLLLARRLTRPLHEMEAATRIIAGGDLSRRLEVKSVDEIGRLATSINIMAADLARLEASRREFIARISHDLRTPLTAIKGLIINLQDVAPTECQPSLITMDEQTDRLIRLVNDLLTLSRLQRGVQRMQMREVDLADVTRSAVRLTGGKAKRMGVELSLVLPESLPSVSADSDRLQQVIVNLIDNALRATPAGGTVILEASAAPGEVLLTVSDTGRGLTVEEEDRAFEAYFSGPGGGAGLGLTIASEIISAHGGRIWLVNLPGGGAEAGIALPAALHLVH